MSSTARAGDVVRQRADWMRPVDERILETMRDEGNMTPQALDEAFEVCAANHASNRLGKMAKYGLVEKLSRGLYRLTDAGEAFLNEELDASELKRQSE